SAAALLSILIPTTRLSAQADGTTIRIKTVKQKGTWITGAAVGITHDSVGIIPARTHDTLRYARSKLHKMEVSRGRKSNAVRGLIGGAAVGLALGVACVASTDEDDWAGCEGGGEVAAFTLTFGALGAGLGALSHRELWEEVPVTSPDAGSAGGGPAPTPEP
ncbi:MAG: hypothetical protein OEV95_00005, partial [Gemmatimonadota bacterium]|nr:hypothetical protein [Gemmatimonadota bacterium]